MGRSAAAKKDVLPVAVRSIELAEIETDRKLIEEAEAKLKEQKARLAGREKDVIARLVAGAEVQGPWAASWFWANGDCRPKWKEAFLTLAKKMGLNADGEEQRVKNETPVPQHRELQITPPGV